MSKKTYNAKVIDTSVEVRSPPTPQRDTSTDDDPLVFKLAAPVNQTQAVDFPSQSEPTIHRWQEDAQLQAFLDKLDDLVDAVSRVEPQMLCRLEMLDKK